MSKGIREGFSNPFLILCSVSKTFTVTDYVKQQHLSFASLPDFTDNFHLYLFVFSLKNKKQLSPGFSHFA